MWDWNLETGELYLDPILKHMLGYEDDEVDNTLEGWLSLTHPEDQEKLKRATDAHIKGMTPSLEIEHRLVHKDGTVRWCLCRGVADLDSSGKAFRMIGSDADITKRKEAEGSLIKGDGAGFDPSLV